MAKNKKSKNIPLPILILICAALVFAMYSSLSTLVLAIWAIPSWVRWTATNLDWMTRMRSQIAHEPFPRDIGL